MAPLCSPLYDALTTAHTLALERVPELAQDPRTRASFVHAARGMALLELSQQVTDPWALKPQNNAGIMLVHGSVSLRVLHQPRSGDVPAPGSNVRRRRDFINPTLSAEMLPAKDALLGLWTVGARGGVSIRVLRPIGVWRYGSDARVDLSFDLPRYADELAGLQFDSTDDDIVVAVPKEDEEDGRANLGS